MPDESIPQKRCCACKEYKPHSDFSRNKSRPDGLLTACKACRSKTYKQYVQRFKEGTVKRRSTGTQDTAWCFKCQTRKPIADFFKNRYKPRGLSHDCKTCNVEARRARRAKHPGAVGVYNRGLQYKKKFGITLTQYEALKNSQNGQCAICSIKPTYHSTLIMTIPSKQNTSEACFAVTAIWVLDTSMMI